MSRPTRRLAALLRRFADDTGGATAMEYGLIVALLSIVVLGAVTSAGVSLYTLMNTLSGKIAGH